MNLNVSKEILIKNNALALDLGINNLVTAVSNSGKTFIIDGRKLKSINQWFNKENSTFAIHKR
ncbi:MAG: transposase [Eubacterium ramulus]